MEIRVEAPTENMLETLGVYSWPIWGKEVSRFRWLYDQQETCYFIEGEVVIETSDGKKIHIGKGDFVTFPKGIDCIWDIKKPVRKHFKFQ